MMMKRNMKHFNNSIAPLMCLFLFCFSQVTEGAKKSHKMAHADTYPNTGRKRIVIAWSKGGGAHKSMLDALRDYLSDEYDIIAYNPLEKIWCKFDPIKVVTLGYMDGHVFTTVFCHGICVGLLIGVFVMEHLQCVDIHAMLKIAWLIS